MPILYRENVNPLLPYMPGREYERQPTNPWWPFANEQEYIQYQLGLRNPPPHAWPMPIKMLFAPIPGGYPLVEELEKQQMGQPANIPGLLKSMGIDIGLELAAPVIGKGISMAAPPVRRAVGKVAPQVGRRLTQLPITEAGRPAMEAGEQAAEAAKRAKFAAETARGKERYAARIALEKNLKARGWGQAQLEDATTKQLEDALRTAENIDRIKMGRRAPKAGAEVPPTKPPIKPPTAVGAIPPEPFGEAAKAERWFIPYEEARNEFLAHLKVALPKAKRISLAMAKRQGLGEAVARSAEALETPGLTGQEALRKATGALSGWAEQFRTARVIEPIMEKISPESGEALWTYLRELNPEVFRQIGLSRKGRYLTKLNAMRAFEKTFIQGILPSQSEERLLQTAFGPQLADLFAKNRGLKESAWQLFLDTTGIPRALLTSFDLSFSLRQGALLAGQPIEQTQAFWDGLKSFARQTDYDAVMKNIQANKWYDTVVDAGLDFTEFVGPRAEESALSRFVSKIPGLKHSQRAFNATANSLRMRTAASYLDKWSKGGKDIPDDAVEGLVRFLNAATGRGNIPQQARELAYVANSVLFSPRLFVSRFQAPFYIFHKSPLVRKAAARNILAFSSGVIGALSLLKLTGVADVELDPQSTDFGKAKIGNTRLDFTAGYGPIIRLVARLATGQRKTTVTGEMADVGWREELTRFARTKLSPVAGFFSDLYFGETLIGEEMEPTGRNVLKQAWERLMPMAIQDLADAYSVDGLEGVIVAMPGILGVGVLPYGMTEFQKFQTRREELAQTLGARWNDLTQPQQRQLMAQYPEIDETAERIAKAAQEYKYDAAAIQRDQEKSHERILRQLPKDVQAELNRLGIKLIVNRTIGTDWFLNEERYDQYQNLTANFLKDRLVNVINTQTYMQASDQGRINILQRYVNMARQSARNQVKAGVGVTPAPTPEAISPYLRSRIATIGR